MSDQLPETDIIELPRQISAAGLRQALQAVARARVLLVVPAGFDRQAALDAGAVPWQLARREADSRDFEVALATRDGRLRALAADAGLPVFGSADGALQRRWHMPSSSLSLQPPPPHRQREPASEGRRGRFAARFRLVRIAEGDRFTVPWLLETLLLAALLVLVVVALSAVLAFIVPVANVTMTPAQEPLAARVSITARSDVDTVSVSEGLVPARRIGQRVEGEDTIEATGSRSAPDQPAVGTVVFTNRSPQPVEIPQGTVVATSTGLNVRFQTTEPVELPGGLSSRVTVPIEALEPGPVGNVRAGTINTIEGSLALSANVINPDPTVGGSVKQVAVVTQGDKDRLRNRLQQQVTQKAYLALGELLEEGEFVPPETVGTIVVAETYDRFTDEAADQVTLRLRLLATGLAVDGAAADELALAALEDEIPRRGRLLADSVSFSRGDAAVNDSGEVTEIGFDTVASGIVVRDVDPAAVRAAIRGLPLAEAVQELQENWRLQSTPELSLGPDWLLPYLRQLDFDWLPLPVADRVPWLPFRTHVRVEFAS